MHNRLPNEPSTKARPVEGDVSSCNNEEGDDLRIDIENRSTVPHMTPSEPSSSRVRSRPPSEPSCNKSHDMRDEVAGGNRDCLEDPLVKKKVRVGDLASLLAGAQPKAG